MRRYWVKLRGISHNVSESYTDREDAIYRARVLRACYDGEVSVHDNNTGRTIYL